MERAKRIAQTLLHPPVWVLIPVPLLSFGALAVIFARQYTETVSAYLIYGMSAYSLAVWVIAAPGVTKRINSAMMKLRPVRRFTSSAFAARYHGDPSYRRMINTVTGGFVCGGVILIAVLMLLHSRRLNRRARSDG